jgi:serine phosphatase RsbU (regulator of sigma subunit)
MDQTNDLMRRLRLDTIATCCYLQLDIAEGTAVAVLAGHPSPILRYADGTTQLILPTDPPLGAVRRSRYRETPVDFPPGASMLLYTDGLVEDSSHPIDRGLAELCNAVRQAPSSDPAEILDHVLRSDVGPHPRRDDIAVLCLTRDHPLRPCPPAAAQ